MDSRINRTSTKLNRQTRLYLWLQENKISLSSLARRIGVSSTTIGKWVRADYIPTKRVEQLRQAGIPEEFLPMGMDVPTGPKPGWKLLQNEMSPLLAEGQQ